MRKIVPALAFLAIACDAAPTATGASAAHLLDAPAAQGGAGFALRSMDAPVGDSTSGGVEDAQDAPQESGSTGGVEGSTTGTSTASDGTTAAADDPLDPWPWVGCGFWVADGEPACPGGVPCFDTFEMWPPDWPYEHEGTRAPGFCGVPCTPPTTYEYPNDVVSWDGMGDGCDELRAATLAADVNQMVTCLAKPSEPEFFTCVLSVDTTWECPPGMEANGVNAWLRGDGALLYFYPACYGSPA